MVFRILHPTLASTRCDASPLARIAGPTSRVTGTLAGQVTGDGITAQLVNAPVQLAVVPVSWRVSQLVFTYLRCERVKLLMENLRSCQSVKQGTIVGRSRD